MIEYLEAARRNRDTLVADRRWFHRHPETGCDLPATAQHIRDRLTAMGLDPRDIGPCGIVATVGGRRGGRTFLLRADMDALPMREGSGLPFASDTDAAHTCGHDLHMAILLGAARLLKDREEELDGVVKLVFQPDEEGLTGASALIEAGVLEDPPVDAALGLHVLSGDMEPGSFTVSAGPVMASSDRFRIVLRGYGGHGAMPHVAIDPIQAGVHLHLALQGIVAREVDARSPLVITVGSFHAGSAANVIPETAELLGTMRTLDEETRVLGRRRIEEVANGIAATFRTRCDIVWLSGTPPVVNDPDLTQELKGYLEKTATGIGPTLVMMGSEDFAFYAARVPGTFLFLGAGGSDPAYRQAFAHHPRVVFNEEALPYGAAALAGCAAAWLSNHK